MRWDDAIRGFHREGMVHQGAHLVTVEAVTVAGGDLKFGGD
ncbi:MAG: hypothetical protein JWL65_3902 [Gammaproteobacteria bacterium]|nr:hypothetical protein [Gammaproteobacteria bacterium]